jgi:hypothetical protein
MSPIGLDLIGLEAVQARLLGVVVWWTNSCRFLCCWEHFLQFLTLVWNSFILVLLQRTASDIAAAYDVRLAQKAREGPELEGLEMWIEKVKNFYFFGFFEGETGEKAPWFLRPSITFPIAFAVVGVAFYISINAGAISERGAAVTDELDEVVLSSIVSTTTSSTSALMAMLMTMMSSSTGIDL